MPDTSNQDLLSPQLLARLERMELVSRKVFRGRLKGERRSRRKGQSVEFAEVAGGQHAFDLFASVRSDYVMLGVAERIQQWHRDFAERT